MKYQVRHFEWGLFQGEFLGLSFWHPYSNEPEQGIYEFNNAKDAEDYVRKYIEKYPHREGEFRIEEFDEELNKSLLETTGEPTN